MNRAEATRQVLLLEAAAAQIQAKAQKLRDDMNADAVAEFKEQGTAATWRLQDIGTWSQPVSQTGPTVSDPTLFAAWVKARWPSEVYEVVNSAFQKALLARLRVDGECVVDPRTGEVAPGLSVRQGGTPLTLRFKANSDAEAVADQHAEQLVKEVTAGLGIGDA